MPGDIHCPHAAGNHAFEENNSISAYKSNCFRIRIVHVYLFSTVYPPTGKTGPVIGGRTCGVNMSSSYQPSLGFVLIFLLFSLLFLRNSYKLWFKTDEYFQDIYNSLTREPAIYPFRGFFLKRMENKQSWILWQKMFSLLGILAVLVADVLVVMAYLQ